MVDGMASPMKQMPLKNGNLYKLGDGLLNQTWNLRYFLLNCSTLQYYKSQHEAKPRDVINLTGATVSWAKDQCRPFAFVVLASGHRPLYMAGNTEREASQWVDWIQDASKPTLESPNAGNMPSVRGMEEPATVLGAGALRARAGSQAEDVPNAGNMPSVRGMEEPATVLGA